MYHTIILAGNLGADPEMRYTPGGQAVTNLNVATNRTYTGSDGSQVKETTWFRVSVWGKQAENCNQYLKKGRPVLIEGRLIPDQTTGGPRIWHRQDGSAAASYEVNAVTVRFLPGRSDTESGLPYSEAGSATEDDIPF